MKLTQISLNQTTLELCNGTLVFFSYNTPVTAFVPGIGYIRTSQHYSVTTSKHINKWLNGWEAKTVDQEEIDSLAI